MFEYFVSTHGSRKGRADTALRTSEAGYLTRRLVDVSQDTVIIEEDCGTEDTRTIYKKFYEDLGETWDKYLHGRVLGRAIAGIEAGAPILAAEIEKINKSGVKEVEIFSLLGCHSGRGVCQKCYGLDLATGEPVKIGSTVGIVAAQAIGEPGTQLTMRTFHTGGAAGTDITSGLPRVEEIFEARTPRNPAVLSDILGKVSVREEENQTILTVSGKGDRTADLELPEGYKWLAESGLPVKVKEILAEGSTGAPLRAPIAGNIQVLNNKARITGVGNVVKEYVVPNIIQLKVKNNDEVKRGDPLTEGHYDLAAALRLAGKATIEQYIIKQVQMIYESQGQGINDKHVEVIARMMLSKVRVVSPGNGEFLIGQIVNRTEVRHINTKLQAEGKKQIVFEDVIMGITRVALKTESWLSAASFQETTSILIEAAIASKVDNLRGLKENVIIGKLIPAGTGLEQ